MISSGSVHPGSRSSPHPASPGRGRARCATRDGAMRSCQPIQRPRRRTRSSAMPPRTWTTPSEPAALTARHSLAVRVPAARKHALHDRKTLLRWLDLLLGVDGVVAVDLLSQLPWPRQALADELAHDADVDIEALFHDPPHPRRRRGAAGRVLAAYPRPRGPRRVRPRHRRAASGVHGTVRRAVPGGRAAGARRTLQPDTDRFTFGHPGGDARLVPADRFMREAGAPFATFRDAPDHVDRRAVLCEPSSRGFLGFGRGDGTRRCGSRSARRPTAS